MIQESDSDLIRHLLLGNPEMRVGRTLGRTLYLKYHMDINPLDDLCVGIVDSADLAREIAARWNAARMQ